MFCRPFVDRVFLSAVRRLFSGRLASPSTSPPFPAVCRRSASWPVRSHICSLAVAARVSICSYLLSRPLAFHWSSHSFVFAVIRHSCRVIRSLNSFRAVAPRHSFFHSDRCKSAFPLRLDHHSHSCHLHRLFPSSSRCRTSLGLEGSALRGRYCHGSDRWAGRLRAG